jgi:hypothetical protein
VRETSLYEPIKLFLQSLGYEVKAEVGPADVMAVRGDEPPVIVELKTGFSLSLLHQATDRQSITDSVYVAVPVPRGKSAGKALERNRKLCRRLGIGLLTVRQRDGLVTVHADPAPYQPRRSKRKQAALQKEFARRAGDPNIGGATRQTLVTAYRQDALRCARFLSENGATRARHVAEGTGVPNARRIMADNHYGWFRRVETGVYALEAGIVVDRDTAATPDLVAANRVGASGP